MGDEEDEERRNWLRKHAQEEEAEIATAYSRFFEEKARYFRSEPTEKSQDFIEYLLRLLTRYRKTLEELAASSCEPQCAIPGPNKERWDGCSCFVGMAKDSLRTTR